MPENEFEYVGRAQVTNLGTTDKIGVFGKIKIDDLVDLLIRTSPNEEYLDLKILPLKEQDEDNTHSIKVK